MEILKGIEIVGLGLYLKEHSALVIGDVHIGIEEAINKQGILLPRTHSKDIMAMMEMLLRKVKPERVIIAGDLKHEFGTISEQEWRDTLQFIDLISKHCKEIILVKGNHDNIIGPIAEKRKVSLQAQYELGDICISHGTIVPKTKAKTIIIGHEHPAVTIGDQIRQERFKCFLVGKHGSKNVIVLPSFNPIVEGTDMLQEKAMSPLLRDIDNFQVYVIPDNSNEPLPFGKLKDLDR